MPSPGTTSAPARRAGPTLAAAPPARRRAATRTTPQPIARRYLLVSRPACATIAQVAGHFGPCELDVERRELRRDGKVVPVEPQVFSTCCATSARTTATGSCRRARAAGRGVGRDQLRVRVRALTSGSSRPAGPWGDTGQGSSGWSRPSTAAAYRLRGRAAGHGGDRDGSGDEAEPRRPTRPVRGPGARRPGRRAGERPLRIEGGDRIDARRPCSSGWPGPPAPGGGGCRAGRAPSLTPQRPCSPAAGGGTRTR
jgi:hypothetical protein